MDEEQRNGLQGLPKECPHCREYNGETWNELKVLVGKYYYVEKGEVHEAMEDVVIKATCTQCDEEVNGGDV